MKMGRFHDYEDEFARADARERELQRQLGMQDGPSRPRSTNNFNNYNRQNSYGAPAQQQSVWDYAGQSRFVNRVGGGKYGVNPNPRAAKTALTVIAVIFYIVSIFLLAIMFIVVRYMRSDYEKCTAEVEAVVVQNVLSSKSSSNSTSVYPVFRYEYNGKVYQQRSHIGRKPAKYSEGEQVTLHIDPDNPSRFYDEKEDTLVMIVISSIAGFFFVLALVFTVCAVAKKKQIQSIME